MQRPEQDALYAEVNTAYRATMSRLARGYEADPERRRDLLQEIHMELWRSLKIFDHRCSIRTWVYRIANNVGASHIARSRTAAARLVDLETLDTEPAAMDGEAQADRQYSATKMLGLIHQLKPLDRQIILLYLEGEAAGPIAEATGLSASNVATKVHRIRKLLTRQCVAGESHARK